MRLCYDIETNGLLHLLINDGKPELPGDAVHCVCVQDIDTGQAWAFGPDQIEEAKALLQQATLLVGHNIIDFDNEAMRVLAGCDLRHIPVIDTLVVGRLMYPDSKDLPKGLPNHRLASWARYCGSHKIEYSGGFTSYSQEMLDYCVQDVAANVQVFKFQEPWINKTQSLLHFEQVMSQICLGIAQNGFKFDESTALNLLDRWVAERDSMTLQLQEYFPTKVTERFHKRLGTPLKPHIDEFNPASASAWVRRLKEKYGWEAPVNDKGNASFDRSVKEAHQDTFPEVALGMEWDFIDKRITMLRKWLMRSQLTGYVRGRFNPQGAIGGRATHSQENLAQVPKTYECRSLFSPCVDGWSLVGCDLSGIEARCLAHYLHRWDKGSFASEILSGDIHTMNQKAAGLPTRDDAKTFLYAMLFGAGDAKIGKIVKGTSRDGQALKERFFKTQPAFKLLLEAIKAKVQSTGRLKLLDGRIVPIRAVNKALNTLLQGAGAIISKYWIVEAVRLLEEDGIPHKICAWVHDELQVCTPPEHAEHVGNLLVQAAATAGTRLGMNMAVHAEFKIGSNWGDTH